VIRPALPADRSALTRLQSYLPEPSPELLDSALDSTALAPAMALVSTTEGEGTGAGSGGDPVAYLLAVPGDGTTYIAELVVAPEHRREGRGRALLSACASRAGDDALTVTVAPDNEAARSLYRACGFVEKRRLPDFFDGGDAVLYRRD
jgi:ribosomal-protein-alanine N-acetyltransferase